MRRHWPTVTVTESASVFHRLLLLPPPPPNAMKHRRRRPPAATSDTTPVRTQFTHRQLTSETCPTYAVRSAFVPRFSTEVVTKNKTQKMKMPPCHSHHAWWSARCSTLRTAGAAVQKGALAAAKMFTRALTRVHGQALTRADSACSSCNCLQGFVSQDRHIYVALNILSHGPFQVTSTTVISEGVPAGV